MDSGETTDSRGEAVARGSSADRLRRAVLRANLDLALHGLVVHTFGNASGVDRASGTMIRLRRLPYGVYIAEPVVEPERLLPLTCPFCWPASCCVINPIRFLALLKNHPK